MLYKGSCHCGNVAFEVEGTIDMVMSCICSICQRKGALMWFAPREQMKLTTPEENAATYTFNRHVIAHRFCPTCGIHPYGEATGPDGHAKAAINVRCIEGIDLDALQVKHYNGRER